jgi:hypothetical protein
MELADRPKQLRRSTMEPIGNASGSGQKLSKAIEK